VIDLLPVALAIELYVSGDWHDITSYRRESADIQISHGRRDEISQPIPSACSMTLDARDGSLAPDNPLGAYYGDLDRNNPLRVTNPVVTDAFARTVSNGWGTSTTLDAWTVDGTAANYSVVPGVGKHSCPRGVSCTSYFPSVTFRDVDMAVTVSVPIASVTGNVIFPANFVFRGVDTNNYFLAGLFIDNTDQSVTVAMYENVAGIFTGVGSQIKVPGLTFSGQALRVRTQIEAGTARVKVWDPSGPEPYGWHGVASAASYLAAGFIGVQSFIDPANTNTNPLVFSYSDLRVRLPLFAGEVSEWPQDWDLSGLNITSAIDAAGIRRRLSQGQSPLSSTLRRGNTTTAPLPIAYWPCEDGKNADQIASALGGPPMLLAGTTDLASYTDIPASAAIPTTKAGYWDGAVPGYTATGQIQVRWVMHVPSSEVVNLGLIMQLHTTGTSKLWEVKYRTGGSLSLEVWAGGSQLLDTGGIGFATIDKRLLVSLELTQNGANVDWKLATLEVGKTSGNVQSGTVTGRTIDAAARVVITPFQEVSGLPLGHISVKSVVTSLFDLSQEFNAFSGELAVARLIRLCAQEKIDLSTEGDPLQSVAMGPQLPLNLIDLLNECADADLGTLYEPRGVLGLAFRTGQSLYNQTAVMQLDYQGGQISDPFKPVKDDQRTRNDITVSRPLGGSARATLDLGRMSTLSPELGGVGRYPDTPSANVANDGLLVDVAGWLLHLGTNGETRYPGVTVNLTNQYVLADATLIKAIRSLGVDDRFDIVRPKIGQSPDNIRQLARGYVLTLGQMTYKVAINSGPESPYHIAVIEDAGSRYDSDASTLSAGVTSSATSWVVAVADVTEGGLWTTTAGDFPFDLRCDGEVVTVTNITGATSPQTFTVTRSINGVVKAHVAGKSVNLANPVYIGIGN
jgi:hypothetical protein